MATNTESESQSSEKVASSPIEAAGEDTKDDDNEDVDIDVTSVPSEGDPLVSSDVDGPSEDDEYFKPIKKLCMAPSRASAPLVSVAAPSSKPLSSFFIKDILNHKPTSLQRTSMPAIVRPWDLDGPASSRRSRPRSADDDSRSERSESDSPESPAVANPNASPLDALFEMTSKAFEGLEANEKASGKYPYNFILFWVEGFPEGLHCYFIFINVAVKCFINFVCNFLQKKKKSIFYMLFKNLFINIVFGCLLFAVSIQLYNNVSKNIS